MRLNIVVSIAVLAAAAAFAQDKQPAEAKPSEQNPPPLQGKEQAAIISVKTLSGDSFNRLSSLLSVFNVRYRSDEKLRTIVVYAAPDIVAQIKKVVEELDRPGSEAAIGRNIEMTLTFLRCSTQPQSGSADLPADLEPVAKQLRAATKCKSVELWESIPLRLQEGRPTEQTLRLPGTLPNHPGANNVAQLSLIPEAVTRKESGRHVRFDRFRINLKLPYSAGNSFQYMDVTLSTAGDFKEGQKTVVGKLSGSGDETSTFVVVSLKVLD